jgi:hypothetical protein
MPRPTSFETLQEYVWQKLPRRRTMVGKEAVFDAVSVTVQEWPSQQFEAFSGIAEGEASDEETAALKDLEGNIKRQMDLVYGDRKFGSVWIIALQFILPIIIRLVYEWWRKRKENKDRLSAWQSKLVGDDSNPPPVDNG